MEVFCLRSNVTADAADMHQGSAAAAAVACVTYCLLSECQAEGEAATEVQLRKGQEVTLPSLTRKEGEFFFVVVDDEGKKKVYEAAKDQEGIKADNKRDSSRRAGIESTSLMY